MTPSSPFARASHLQVVSATGWLRSDLRHLRSCKALHYGTGVPRYVLVWANWSYAVGSATGSEVVDIEEWATRERVPLPLAEDLVWLRG